MSGPRFAYWIRGKSVPEVAANPPARLRLAWPNDPTNGAEGWMVQAHPSGDGALIVFPRHTGAAASLEEFGDPRETHDGMVYYPSREAPTRDWLIRPEATRPSGEWVKADQGELYIAVAWATPRRLTLLAGGGFRSGKGVSEFGALGHDIFDAWTSKAGISPDDPRLWRFLFLAIRASYWVTEEILEDLDWLTDADVVPIVSTALGCNPKPSADAPAGSHSSAPTTPASP